MLLGWTAETDHMEEERPSSEDGTAKKVYPIDDGLEKAGGWLNQDVWATGSVLLLIGARGTLICGKLASGLLHRSCQMVPCAPRLPEAIAMR